MIEEPSTTNAVTEGTLAEIVETVWSTVLALSVTPRCDPPCVQSSRTLAACVHIVGNWNGTVLYMSGENFARRAASIMFDLPLDAAAAEDMHDAAAELCNIVAGNLKAVLPGPSSLSLPMVTEGGDYELRIRRSKPLLHFNFRCERDTLQVIVLQSEEANS